MRETLKMMKSILTGNEKKTKEQELIKEYQEKLSPNILAYFYCNNFGLIYNVSQSYKIISDEDKASFCLQILDECLVKYNFNTKFITYFITCYTRKLNMETKLLNYDKRKSLINYIDLEQTQLSNEMYINDFNLILDNYKLSKTEKLHCKLLNYGYSLTEISKIFKVSLSAISQRNNKLKKKILHST